MKSLVYFYIETHQLKDPHKLKPILSVDERTEILQSIKYIDYIQYYTYEDELVELLVRDKSRY